MKKLITFALCSAILLTSCQGKGTNSEASDNGNSVHGVVTSAIGNELTLELGEVTTSGSDFGGENPSATSGERPSFAEGEVPNLESRDMIVMPEGEMPDLESRDMIVMPEGEMPDLESRDMIVMPEGDGSTTQSESTTTGKGNRGGSGMSRGTTIQRSGETKIFTINVNTPVYMVMGSKSIETTFSNIKTNDILKLTIENDIVTAVSILGQEATTNASN